MWMSREHYDWLLNVNPNERVAAQRETGNVLIVKMQTENYMLQEKIGELNILVRRLEKQVADKDMRDYGVDSKWGKEAQKMAEARDPTKPFIEWRDPKEICDCGCGLTLEPIRKFGI